MDPATRTIGTATVVALTDGTGLFYQPVREAFPDVPEETWLRAAALDPVAHATNGQWRMQFHCFGVRLPDDRVILVDAGIGPADSPAAAWAPVPGDLPARLDAAGISPEQVDTVVLSHLHTDHVGWAVVRDGAGERTPYFANARYVLQKAELDAISMINPSLEEALIAPLRATDQLSIVDGDSRLASQVRIVATPGHTPGHQSVLVETDETALLIAGDLLVHAVQLVDPDVAYRLEVDPAMARDSRVRMLNDLAGRGSATLAVAHVTEPFHDRPGDH
jgi:glyoxylase-like metal-dependent hydrolase (beta-lactamase superfamily II)